MNLILYNSFYKTNSNIKNILIKYFIYVHLYISVGLNKIFKYVHFLVQ